MANMDSVNVQLNPPQEKAGKNYDCSKSNGLYCVVLWCFCAMGILTGGYSLYRQQFLEDRLMILEEQYMELRGVIMAQRPTWVTRLKMYEEDKVSPTLYRQTRDVNDCICPQG